MSGVEWTASLNAISAAFSACMAVATGYFAWKASKTLEETRKSRKLEELRQRLEDVYAPVYTALCGAAGGVGEFSNWLDNPSKDKLRIVGPSLDSVIKVFAQYSYLVSRQLHDNWIKMNKAGVDTYAGGQPSGMWSYQIDLGRSRESVEFCREVGQEYDKLVKEYRDLAAS